MSARRIATGLAAAAFVGLLLASSEGPVNVDPFPFPPLPDNAGPNLRAARADAEVAWRRGRQPQPELIVTCRLDVTCDGTIERSSGRIVQRSPSGTDLTARWSTVDGAWAALIHVADAPDVQRARLVMR